MVTIEQLHVAVYWYEVENNIQIHVMIQAKDIFDSCQLMVKIIVG